jgi:Pretoxin HINT domain
MARHDSDWARRFAVCGCFLAVVCLGQRSLGDDAGGSRTGPALVADALRAEATGNGAQRSALLDAALVVAPEFSPARWHSGQVRVGDAWLAVDEAQQAAAADPKRAEYERLRAASDESFDSQLALARWCRKNGFDDEARLHWANALGQEPQNDEALRALGVRWRHGRLMTFDQIAAEKKELREANEAARQFAPQLARWERQLAAGDIKSRDEALAAIRAIRDQHAIPAMEEITLDERLSTNAKFEKCLEVSQAFVAALDEMPDQAATESLLRHAALSPLKSVRESAITALKKRSPHDYVPQLLAALTMPIESSYRVVRDDDGCVHYFHSLYREGPRANWSFEGRWSAMQEDLQGPTFQQVDDRVRGEVRQTRFPARNNGAVKAEMASVAAANAKRFGRQASARESQVAAINQTTDAANRVIVPVLAATTGHDFGDNPRLWWDWWDRYNEYSTDGTTPEYDTRVAESTHRYYRLPGSDSYRIDPPPTPSQRRYSCFAKGTLVWTKTGEREIESLRIGDLVLAQDSDSGELAYKPVIGRTVRPPSPTLTLSIEKEEIRTTLGHPLWVDGSGWRMAKELGDGAILHSVHGPVRIGAIAAADKCEAYNLIVADFNTYFVGQSGILVHDNTPRDPTTAIVPGLARK